MLNIDCCQYIIRRMFGFIALSLMLLSAEAFSKEYQLTPEDDLQAFLNLSANGDIITLAPGAYYGNFTIDKSISLIGKDSSKQAIIDAKGKGNALLLTAPNIRIQGITITNWGHNLTDQNAGIYSEKNATGLNIVNNKLTGPGFGMWLQKGKNILVENNLIEGDLTLRSADRGNGIQLSMVDDVLVKNNRIFHTRDGVYIISSKHSVIENNTMHDLRYGVHYMYSDNNQVLNNHAYQTRAGFALMSSRHLTVTGNISENNEDYGFLLNFITYSTIDNNTIKHIWTKPENKVLGRDGKGLFVYNSAYNQLSNNLIDTTEIGIHLTAGSENTKVYGNSFINNHTQVKYVSNKEREWSEAQQGNFWSNYLGWDFNNDNIGDVAFEPNDGIDTLLWQYPEAKILMDSPAVILLRWVQRQFPILKPPGVKDSYPLMESPHISGASPRKTDEKNMKQNTNPNKHPKPHLHAAN